MDKKIKRGIRFLSTILLGTKLSAQTDEWKTATSKNGKVRAKYHFPTRVNEEIYSFRELENGQLEITIKTTASPGFKVPAILMKKAFPKKLFDTMEKFIQVSSMEKKENTFQTKTD